MKKSILILLLLTMLLFAACDTQQPQEPTEPTDTSVPVENSVPQELVGTWSSANSGELDMTETFTFNEDGTLSAYAIYHGTQSSTVTGTFTIVGHTLYCEVTGGVSEPYNIEYEFRVDGRELFLTDDDGQSQFLRVS